MQSFITGSDISTITDKYALSASGRPLHLIPPKLKDRGWCLQMVKCAHNEFRHNCPYLFYNNSTAYTENIRYFQALLNPLKYMDLYDNNQSETRNDTNLARDKRILNVASKYIRILKGRLADLKFDITATPVNALARQHEEEFTQRIRAAMKINAIAKQAQLPAVQKMLQDLGFDSLPVDTEELEIQKSNLSIPYQMAMNIELFLKYANSVDNLEDKLCEEDLDAILNGVYATKVTTNADGTPIAEKIDPRNLLVGFSNTENFRDVSEIGQYRTISVNEMKEEDIHRELSDDDYYDIERNHVNYTGSNANYFDYTSVSQDLVTKRALVLDLYFYSMNEEVKVVKNNRSGNPRVHMKDFGYYKDNEADFYKNNPNKKLYRTPNQVVYKCTWIVGTDYCYNFGLLRETARTQSDPYRTKLPILIYAPLIKDGQTHSMMDELKPLIDSANLKWQRIQEAIAKAKPPGMVLDIDGLLGAVEQMGDKEYNIKKVLGMAVKENIHIVSGSANKYGANGAKSVTELFGGLGPDFSGWMDGLRSDLMLMQEITGFNSIAAGSPEKYMGKGVSDNVMETADYSIKHLYEAKRIHFEDICRLKTVLGMDQISSGQAIGIRNAIGVDAYEYIHINSMASKYEYNIVIKHMPSDQIWADLYSDVQIAMQMGPEQGGINIEDSLFIKECTTIKQARAYLYNAVRSHKREYQANQKQAMEDNAKLSQQTAQNAAQLRHEEMQAQTQVDSNKIKLQKEADLEKLAAQHQYDMELAQLESQSKSGHINQEGQYDIEDTTIKSNAAISRLRTKE